MTNRWMTLHPSGGSGTYYRCDLTRNYIATVRNTGPSEWLYRLVGDGLTIREGTAESRPLANIAVLDDALQLGLKPVNDATRRRICWPNPDATCLEGGCIHCNDHSLRSIASIRRYALGAGTLPNRGVGTQNAYEAFMRGLTAGWHGVETR
jgi:hypothetical protein